MSSITNLLEDYSLETMILSVLFLLVICKFFWELIIWIYEKVKVYFNFRDKQDRNREKILDKIDEIKNDVVELKTDINVLSDQIEYVKEIQQLDNDRFLVNTKERLVERHNYFCYQAHAIDDMSRQNLEELYEQYRLLGGNSYVHSLMEDIRNLPSIEEEALERRP